MKDMAIYLRGWFKSETVEDERYLLTVLRYIHQNPLKAGVSKNVLNCNGLA